MARARHDPRDLTAAGRAAFLSQFMAQARELHPDANEAKLQRVAAELKRAHFLRLAVASSRARAKKKAPSVADTESAQEEVKRHARAHTAA